ncbi:unnamed protein product [Urochloa humidicola]
MNRLEVAWELLAAGLAKLRRAIDGDGESLSSDEYMLYYTMVYDMCTPHNYLSQLHQRYKEDMENYMKSTVLPPLMEMEGELLLRELVDTWRRHNRIAKLQAQIFGYLDCHSSRRCLPSLRIVSLTSFQDMVFNEIKSRVTASVISMIDDERDGNCIDRDLLKNVLDIFVQIGHSLDYYHDGLRAIGGDFGKAFFEGTRNYYSRKAQTWNMEYSDHDYMVKVEECLQKEKERVAYYMYSSTVPELMEVVRSALITRHAELKKEVSGGEATK